ncbi:Adenylate kinase-like kinase [Frankia canadensis]|uniref:Adenylate kinase-like kinase n=1 Tax=Frankia canadensis TaxID=1836972 RepID=A0A2I2KK53_9ACTN|nr:adenylate kinase [Frankia canadensis]SNQ46049.1 Adenylate kinase-like kinase [Frankia canadensis]SOU53339.1 Adenylate kinase-like kinase [Frankia canadensis]
MNVFGTGRDGPPSMTPDVRRVLVVGSGGAGKSTLARELARQAGLPVVHLDRLFWRPGWVATPVDEWRAIVAGLVAGPAWVLDGNYSGTLDLRIPAAELIVFLDLPRRIAISRVVRRWARWRGRSRPDMAPECPEKLDLAFLGWLWTYPRDSRDRLLRAIDAHGAAARVVRLCSPREVRLWLGAAAAPGLVRMRPLPAGRLGT